MKASDYERVVHDWYREQADAVEALLAVERFRGLCWDPAAGGGNIPAVLRANGLRCAASDLVDRGCGADIIDFFRTRRVVDNVICNPPYGKLIVPWVQHALQRATRKVAILAKLTFLETVDRDPLLGTGPGDYPSPLARVWVFRRRQHMPPGGRDDIDPEGGKVAYAWFIWERGHRGPWTGGRI
jgi:hypothetical protein